MKRILPMRFRPGGLSEREMVQAANRVLEQGQRVWVFGTADERMFDPPARVTLADIRALNVFAEKE